MCQCTVDDTQPVLSACDITRDATTITAQIGGSCGYFVRAASANGDFRAKFYQVTAAGAKRLEAERSSFEEYASAVFKVLNGGVAAGGPES